MTTKTLRLRWLRFKRHIGPAPVRRRRANASALRNHSHFSSADHGTRGLASSASTALPRTFPGRQTWRGPVFALLALSLLALATVAQAA